MRILNQQFVTDLEAGRPIRLDLGSGGKRKPGFYAVDHLALEGVDIVADLNQPLALIPDQSVDHVYTRHVLEHIHEFLPLMREIHRVCKPGAQIEIIVPHFSNVYGFSDPTHVRFFGIYTMNYFVRPESQLGPRKVPAFYTQTRFELESVHIDFYRSGRIDRLLAGLFTRWVNRSMAWQDFYERRCASWFHAWQITFRMRRGPDA
jgi:SAM-dependent methyltransferase